MNKLWKEIKGYEGKYIISNYGEVVSLPRYKQNKSKLQYVEPREIKTCVNKKNGYVYILLCNDSKEKNFRLHRLVAEHFIDNPNNYKQVNHIDGNKQNNKADNLEWCTASYNIKDMYKRNGKYEKDKAIIKDYLQLKSCKKVAKIHNLSSEYIRQILIRNNIKIIKGWLEDE